MAVTESDGPGKGCGQMFLLILAIPAAIGTFGAGALWWMF